MLDVTDVVEDDGVEDVESVELFFETEIALGSEQTLHERERRREPHPAPAAHELVSNGTDEVRFPASRKPKCEDVVAAVDETSFAERGQELLNFRWKKVTRPRTS